MSEDRWRADRIAGVLLARDALHACPMCSHKTWTTTLGEGSPVIYAETGTPGTPQRTMPVQLLVCEKCGFVRMHSTKTLEDIEKTLADETPSDTAQR